MHNMRKIWHFQNTACQITHRFYYLVISFTVDNTICDQFGSMKLRVHDIGTKPVPISLTNLITVNATTRMEIRP